MAKARFFYALRPDPAAADQLAAIAAQAATRWGGRAFAAPDIHLTLAFVGMQPVERQPALQAILQGLPARFHVPDDSRATAADAQRTADADPIPALSLSRLGSFGHGVLWIGPAKQADGAGSGRSFAHRLAQEIRARLRDAGIAFDDRPLKLHATIVRGARGFTDERGVDLAGTEEAGDAGAGRLAVAASPIVVARTWSLALGASYADSTPLRRYRWWGPAAPAGSP
ncbi:MAG: hypothetical protein LT106_06920 [Burkholderiaceae bacterium]|nr:hypothetical protein [Burkholderiaceae bacterium]